MNSQILQKASMLYDIGRYDEVITLLESDPSQARKGVGAWYYSSSLMKRNQFQNALNAAGVGLGSDPEFYPLFLLRSHIYLHLGVYSKARKDVQNALRIAPEDADCHIEAGFLYLALDQFDSAIQSAETALSLEPESINARLIKVSALYQQDHEKEARALAKETLRLDPTEPVTIELLADLTKNRSSKASLLERALKLAPHDKDIQNEFREYTVNRKRDIQSAAGLTFIVLLVWFLMPGEQEDAFKTIIPVVGPLVLLYYSKQFWLSASMLFIWLLCAGVNDTGFVFTEWLKNPFWLNMLYLIAIVLFSLVASYVLHSLRFVFTGLINPLKWKWKQYSKAKEHGMSAENLAEIVASRRTYYYLIGAFFLPLANVIAHRFSPAVFWSCFAISFVVFCASLVLFGRIVVLRSVISSAFLYGFITILVTLFAGALLDTTFTTTIALFIGASCATHLAYVNSVGHTNEK